MNHSIKLSENIYKTAAGTLPLSCIVLLILTESTVPARLVSHTSILSVRTTAKVKRTGQSHGPYMHFGKHLCSGLWWRWDDWYGLSQGVNTTGLGAPEVYSVPTFAICQHRVGTKPCSGSGEAHPRITSNDTSIQERGEEVSRTDSSSREKNVSCFEGMTSLHLNFPSGPFCLSKNTKR